MCACLRACVRVFIQVAVSNNHLVNVSHMAWELQSAGHSISMHSMPAPAAEAAGQLSLSSTAVHTTQPPCALTDASADADANHPRQHQLVQHQHPAQNATVAAASAQRIETAVTGVEIDSSHSKSTDGWALLQAHTQGMDVLVGASYYASKQRMLDAEQILMRTLRFQMLVEQPHALLLNLASQLRAPGGMVEVALALLSDAWCCSTACRFFTPLELAVAVLELARDAMQVDLEALHGLPAAMQDAAQRSQPKGREAFRDGKRECGRSGAGEEHVPVRSVQAVQVLHWCELFGVERGKCCSCMEVCLRAVQGTGSSPVPGAVVASPSLGFL